MAWWNRTKDAEKDLNDKTDALKDKEGERDDAEAEKDRAAARGDREGEDKAEGEQARHARDAKGLEGDVGKAQEELDTSRAEDAKAQWEGIHGGQEARDAMTNNMTDDKTPSGDKNPMDALPADAKADATSIGSTLNQAGTTQTKQDPPSLQPPPGDLARVEQKARGGRGGDDLSTAYVDNGKSGPGNVPSFEQTTSEPDSLSGLSEDGKREAAEQAAFAREFVEDKETEKSAPQSTTDPNQDGPTPSMDQSGPNQQGPDKDR